MIASDSFNAKLNEVIGKTADPVELEKKISKIVDSRLDELTPIMVKEIIQDMIKKHLGWLVVWGGVFGGIIGFIGSFFM